MKRKTLYRVAFVNQEKVYEIYARKVEQKEFFGFVLLEELVFGESSSLVVDPGQEKMKTEFQDVKRTYVPLHSILRIDEVERAGIAKIFPKEGNISQFPSQIYTKPTDHFNS